MGNFRSDNRSGGFRDRAGGGGRSFGGDRGGRSGGFGGRRFGGDRDRGRLEMHDVVCTKCGKECQVPFKPTGSKPVLCSDCFRNEGGGNRGRSFGSNSSSSPQSGMSSEQFNQINAKLDKIITFLDQLEIEEDLGEEEDEEEEEEIEEEGKK